ncbi:hypothetical protein BJ170DRAFT_687275 [Xylariales sp. AK1849]|nr:hypothetical protein BJ170DRAFT_687275 [Xylariales sp. AK1849]
MLRVRAGQITTSGSIAAVSLLSVFLLSLRFIRIHFYSILRISHTVLALGTLASLFWHILLLPAPSVISRIAVYSAATLWALTVLTRLARVIYHGRATIKKRWELKNVVYLHVRLNRRVHMTPGNYFYALLPSAYLVPNVFDEYPLVAVPFDFAEPAEKGI